MIPFYLQYITEVAAPLNDHEFSGHAFFPSGLRFSNSALHLLRFTNHNLVGGFNPSEKYEFVSWDYEIPN